MPAYRRGCRRRDGARCRLLPRAPGLRRRLATIDTEPGFQALAWAQRIKAAGEGKQAEASAACVRAGIDSRQARRESAYRSRHSAHDLRWRPASEAVMPATRQPSPNSASNFRQPVERHSETQEEREMGPLLTLMVIKCNAASLNIFRPPIAWNRQVQKIQRDFIKEIMAIHALYVIKNIFVFVFLVAEPFIENIYVFYVFHIQI